eukprot:CAMPEP_0183548016 /NCGR_PEP_ID=MMETSP0371-20130417/57760_1 /TAXON_ID=268820 /ORGANISM="Peridinium aciculiferum, Strain PAER-2" /LENGTH=261 /DNA_ID=CAMNT_0025751191 /DNA_START=74 /DNA_END=859 /DNA_ORIENTATION=-
MAPPGVLKARKSSHSAATIVLAAGAAAFAATVSARLHGVFAPAFAGGTHSRLALYSTRDVEVRRFLGGPRTPAEQVPEKAYTKELEAMDDAALHQQVADAKANYFRFRFDESAKRAPKVVTKMMALFREELAKDILTRRQKEREEAKNKREGPQRVKTAVEINVEKYNDTFARPRYNYKNFVAGFKPIEEFPGMPTLPWKFIHTLPYYMEPGYTPPGADNFDFLDLPMNKKYWPGKNDDWEEPENLEPPPAVVELVDAEVV